MLILQKSQRLDFEHFVSWLMDNDALQQTLLRMQSQLNEQSAQLQHVSRENAELRASATRTEQRLAASDDLRNGREVDDRLADLVTPHLQLIPLPNEDRKRLLAPYPRYNLPASIRDANGFGGRTIANPEAKRWVTSHLPQFQREALDVARIACAAWHQAHQAGSQDERVQLL